MAFTVNIVAENVADLGSQLLGILSGLKGLELVPLAPPQEAPEITPEPVNDEPIEPVLTQERMEENLANAPVHEEPKQPSLTEVRAALKAMRDKRGAEAVKALLAEYGANSVPELKEEDYLIVRDRAAAEV